MLSVQPGLRGSNDLRVGTKMATFQFFFFSVQGTGGSPTGPDPENRGGDQDTGSPGRQVSSGLQSITHILSSDLWSYILLLGTQKVKWIESPESVKITDICSRVQKFAALIYKSRAKWKML